MMKILAVMGSPRGKGCGYRIVRMVENRMKALGEVEFEYLFLKDANLKPCTGCYNCMARGEDKCPLKDDRATIEQALVAADGVILSTPMHVLNVSSLMKNFIDRFAHANHRPRFHRLKIMTVVNMGGDSPKALFACMRWALGGSQIVHELGVATPPWRQTVRAVKKKERAIDAAARKFHTACLDKSPPAPTLGRLIVFLIRQRLSLQARQVLPADHAFFSGKTYYFDAPIHPLSAALAKVIASIAMFFLRDLAPGNVAWPVAKRAGDCAPPSTQG